MRRSLNVIGVVVLAASCATVGPAGVPSPDGGARADALALVGEAEMRLASGDVAEGLKLFRRAVALDPASDELKEEFGLALADAGVTDEAVRELRAVPHLGASGEATLGMLLAQDAQTPADLEGALPHLEKGLAAVPQGSQARLLLVQSLVRLSRGAEAWTQLQGLLDDHPDDPRLLLIAGESLRQQGKFDEAAAYFKRAAATPDMHQRATLELVETLADAGKFKEAAQLFGDFLNKEGATLAGLTRWATLLARAGDRTKAREVLDKVLAGDPDQRDALLLKALIEAGDGHVDAAEQLYRKVLAAHPDDPDAALGLARLLIDVRRLDEARALLDGIWKRIEGAKAERGDAGNEVAQERAALELVDHKPEAALPWLQRCQADVMPRRTLALWGEYYRQREAFKDGAAFVRSAKIGDEAESVRLRSALLAEFLFSSGESAQGEQILKELTAGGADDVTAALGVLEREKRYGEAVDDARRAIARLGPQPAIHFALAAALERSGAWDEAVKEFRALIAKDPEDAAALNYLGYMFADHGVNLPEAKEMLTKAVGIDPTSGAYLDSLGWVYFRLGEVDRAEKYLTEAIHLEPFDATVQEHVGDLLRARGEAVKAAAAYRQALANKPDEEGQKERIEKKLAEVAGVAAR
ncbi:MAG TPA: tetratricopeptide repeat protein [Thermoanaerobaculaceae bacterium]|nr:tetratricopeptide repeat protein [Thermoanaerobaculaceae bacterium]